MAKAKLPKVSPSTIPPYSGPRLREHRIALVRDPVERAAVDDQAADRIAVSAEELGRRMDDDVGAVLERAA